MTTAPTAQAVSQNAPARGAREGGATSRQSRRTRWTIPAIGVVAYLVAAYLGRLTVPEGEQLALVWPASGVVVVWFALVGWRRTVWVDLLLLFTVATVANALTGAGTALALQLGVAAVVQVVVVGLVLARFAPRLWGPRPADRGPGLRHGSDLGMVLAAILLACGTAALVPGVTLEPLLSGQPGPAVNWVVRNGVAMLAFFPFASLGREAWRSRAHTRDQHARQRDTRAEALEGLALLLVTGLLVAIVLTIGVELPVAFLVLATSVWAGTRLGPLAANLHAVLLSSAIVAAFAFGLSGFAPVDGDPGGAAVTQLWVAFTAGLTMVLALDSAQRRRLHTELSDLHRRTGAQADTLARVLDAMAEGVAVIDPAGTVVMRNRAGERLMSGAAAPVGAHIEEHDLGFFEVDGSPVDRDRLPSVQVRDGEQYAARDLLVRAPGSPEGRLLEVRASPMEMPGLGRAVLLVYDDVTAARRERDALASFAGVVAHDLASPLSTVSGWSEVLGASLEDLAENGEPPPSAVRALQRIQTATRDMRSLIDDLLAYAMARDVEVGTEPVSLESLALDVARARSENPAAGRRPEITVGAIPPVLGDATLLRQLVDNLVGNAVKYVAPGVVPHVTVTGRRVDDAVLVEITDNGIGIPDDQLDLVFDAFHRAHREGYHGTGLGLSIVRKIVERHSGSVRAQQNPAGPGTCFVVSLPAAPAPVETPAEGPVETPAEGPVETPAGATAAAPSETPDATFGQIH